MKNIIKLNASIISAASVVGKDEHEGPLGDRFDFYSMDDRFGQDTWEQAESEMQRMALNGALAKGKFKDNDISALFAGDLQNQCVGSGYGLMDFNIPYFGLYGACSTSMESVILASIGISGGIFEKCAAVTSSHNCAAERQYRSPIEYGCQRPPSAQWTVTGSGAFILGNKGRVKICEAVVGKVNENGINDANNMGAAMAPAAADTLLRYFYESGNSPDSFDIILTGDLGAVGAGIFCDLVKQAGITFEKGKYNDCGMMIYDLEKQSKYSGGSGCGCSAVVCASWLIPRIISGEITHALFMSTGAMMSPSSIQQGLAIPAIAHLVHFQYDQNGD